MRHCSVLIACCISLAVCLIFPGLLNAEQQPPLNQLERLFTTSYERAQLDARRRRDDGRVQSQEARKQEPLPPLQVELKGLLIRENAPNVVWLNNNNTLEGDKVSDRISIKTDKVSDTKRVPVVISGKHIGMKPGQVWNELDNTLADKFMLRQEKNPESKSDEPEAEATESD